MAIKLDLNDAAKSAFTKAAIAMFAGFLISMCHVLIPTSFGDTIFHIGHPLHMLYLLFIVLVGSFIWWMIFRALNHMGLYPISFVFLTPGILIVLTGAYVIYEYVMQVYTLATDQYVEVSGAVTVYPPGTKDREFVFQVNNHDFVLKRGANNTRFSYYLNRTKLTQYPAVRIAYTANNEILRIVGITDNNALEPTR